jgi:hypothetical protein
MLRERSRTLKGVSDSGAFRSQVVPELKRRPYMRRIVKHFFIPATRKLHGVRERGGGLLV